MPKLTKEICQKCYRYHERVWTEDQEEDWAAGSITCPVDHFDVMLHKGKPVNVEKPIRNLMGAIFGWIENKSIPKWCQYAEEHSKKKQSRRKAG